MYIIEFYNNDFVNLFEHQ